MDPKAEIIRHWVDVYSEGLFRWAYQRVQQRETAQDLVQEVFHAAVANFEKFEYRSNPKTWLFSILHHKIADHYRKVFYQKTESVSFDSTSHFNEQGAWNPGFVPGNWPSDEKNLADDEEFRKVLNDCMKKLPPNWYSAIQYKYIEEKESEEICQELGITPTNYWQMVHRAKLQLRKCVENNWINV